MSAESGRLHLLGATEVVALAAHMRDDLEPREGGCGQVGSGPPSFPRRSPHPVSRHLPRCSASQPLPSPPVLLRPPAPDPIAPPSSSCSGLTLGVGLDLLSLTFTDKSQSCVGDPASSPSWSSLGSSCFCPQPHGLPPHSLRVHLKQTRSTSPLCPDPPNDLEMHSESQRPLSGLRDPT